MVGLSIMLAWGPADLAAASTASLPAGLPYWQSAACLCCAVLAAAQVQHWRNSESLFEHALAVTGGNYVAHNNLGTALEEIPGRLPEAIAHYQSALRINPNSAEAHNNLGNAWAQWPGRLPDLFAAAGPADSPMFNLAKHCARSGSRRRLPSTKRRAIPTLSGSASKPGHLLMRMPGPASRRDSRVSCGGASRS